MLLGASSAAATLVMASSAALEAVYTPNLGICERMQSRQTRSCQIQVRYITHRHNRSSTGNVDDHSFAALFEQRSDGLQSANGALDIDVKGAIKVVEVGLCENK